MSFIKQATLLSVVALLVAYAVPAAARIDLDQLRAEREARRAQIDAEREARRAERDDQNNGNDETTPPSNDENDNDTGDTNDEPATCSCSASVKFSRPSLQFRGGTLTFIPRVDINVRSRGEFADPDWTARVAHSGTAHYESEDVTAPAPTNFSGSQDVFHGTCGSSYRHNGYDLPAVPLSGLVSSLLGVDQELDGTVDMEATLSACSVEDVEHRQFGFSMEEFGNFRVRGWRSVR